LFSWNFFVGGDSVPQWIECESVLSASLLKSKNNPFTFTTKQLRSSTEPETLYLNLTTYILMGFKLKDAVIC